MAMTDDPVQRLALALVRCRDAGRTAGEHIARVEPRVSEITPHVAKILMRIKEAGARTPATLAALLDGYVENLRLRGKAPETLAATRSAKSAIARDCPDLLRLPVSALDDAAFFRFKAAREHAGCKASTVNRNLGTLLAAVRLVRPELRVSKGLFRKAPERVRWLAPEEELPVLDPLPLRHVAKLAALTLMRLSEIRRL